MAERPPLGIACDHAGFQLKRELLAALEEWGEAFEDLGTHDESSCDYPDFAHQVAEGVASGRFRLGVLVCGTGLGMAMAANKHEGVRAAPCTDSFSAHATREHNDANVICFGQRVVGAGVARDALRAFLDASFEGGRHARRVGKIEGA